MITKENIRGLLLQLGTPKISEAIDKQGDYIALEFHIFNTGAYSTIKSMDYDSKTEMELQDNGQLFTDKDSFLNLLDELGIDLE